MNDLLVLVLLIAIGYIFAKLWECIIFPFIIEKSIQEVEKNPNWITPKLKQRYYGFSDIDITTARSSLGAIPRFRLHFNKKEKNKIDRLELLIPEDTSVNDIDKVAALALAAKIRIFYGLTFTDKSAHWLSILLYMLDGGEINEMATSFEEKDNTKQETS